MDDLLHDTSDVTVSFGVVQGSELGCSLSQSGVSSEDGTCTLSLVSDNSTCAMKIKEKRKTMLVVCY